MKLLFVLVLVSSALCQQGQYTGQNCATAIPVTDPGNEGCATCIPGNFFRNRVVTRLLADDRLLQGVKIRWTCLPVGVNCATPHTNEPTATQHGCASCNVNFSRTQMTTRILQEKDRLLQGAPTRWTCLFTGSNCGTTHPATDPANEGCSTCLAGPNYRIPFVARILAEEDNRLLQGAKARWTCLTVGSNCATSHPDVVNPTARGCATCNVNFTRTQITTRLLQGEDRLLQTTPTRWTCLFTGSNCLATHPVTDAANEGCATCQANSNFYRTRVTTRLLSDDRLLQGTPKARWTCTQVGTSCLTFHPNDAASTLHGCATCANGLTRTQLTTRLLQGDDRLLQAAPTRWTCLFTGTNCATTHPVNDPANEGCATCQVGPNYRIPFVARILADKDTRLLQGAPKARWTCLTVGSNCATVHPDVPNPTMRGCATCNANFTRTQITTRLLADDRLLQVGPTRWTCIANAGPLPVGANCATTHVPTDALNSGCETCRVEFFRSRLNRRLLTEVRTLQGTPKTVWTCLACRAGCNRCTDTTTCLMTDGCKVGFFATAPFCTACTAPCSACTSAAVCTACANEHFLKGTACVKCAAGCSTCTSETVCTACLGTHTLKNGSCSTKPFYQQVWFFVLIGILTIIAVICVCCMCKKSSAKSHEMSGQEIF